MSEFRGWGGAALVTGASSGIGLELARALAARGMDLILVARSAENLRILADNLATSRRVRTVAVPVDLAAVDGPERLMQQLAAVEMNVDMLVNNAGFGIYGQFGRLGAEREAEMVRLNVSAPTELAARLLPGMIRRKRGLILNVASTAGFAPVPWLGTYGATKAYLLHWTTSLDVELSGSGVRVCVLCPGTTATNFHAISGAAVARRRKLPQQSAAAVARECLRGVDRGRRVIVTGWINRCHVALTRVVPPGLAARIARAVMGPVPGRG
jgi:short-subunit dehydrogenase